MGVATARHGPLGAIASEGAQLPPSATAAQGMGWGRDPSPGGVEWGR